MKTGTVIALTVTGLVLVGGTITAIVLINKRNKEQVAQLEQKLSAQQRIAYLRAVPATAPPAEKKRILANLMQGLGTAVGTFAQSEAGQELIKQGLTTKPKTT